MFIQYKSVRSFPITAGRNIQYKSKKKCSRIRCYLDDIDCVDRRQDMNV
jgi:hypothetical protein